MPDIALENLAVHQLCAFAARRKALVRLADVASAGGRKWDTRRRSIPSDRKAGQKEYPLLQMSAGTKGRTEPFVPAFIEV